MEGIKFAHLWVVGFGWEVTIFQPKDFHTVDEISELFYLAMQYNGKVRLFKGL